MQPTSDDQQQQVAALEAEQEQLVRELGREGGASSREDRWITADELSENLPAGSVLVNIAGFWPYDFKTQKRESPIYVAWVIPAKGQGKVQIIDLGDAVRIDAAVADAREAVAEFASHANALDEAKASAEVEAALEPLANMIWKPLAEATVGAKELILSPDGALWLAPWAALPIENGKYLLEKFKIRYVTSGRELVDKPLDPVEVGAPVVVADPDFNLSPGKASGDSIAAQSWTARRSDALGGVVERLPGTAREAQAITPSLEKIARARPLVYLQERATEQQFKQIRRPRVLVASTHGFFLEDQQFKPQPGEMLGGLLIESGDAPENPLLRCGLLLAGANRRREAAANVDDGVLTGLEIVGTDLRGTEMVVLSACDTGVGEIRSGEGVAGLRQAFQLAGARSVMASLWQIPDEETVQLVNDYFGYLSEGQTKSEALRSAQLARIADHRERRGAAHPYYWAAFTITGCE
jgi:CHAT domain-containing protein